MASTYVNDLRLNEMATGDGSGTWGTTTNTNLELIAEAFSYGTEVITTNADTHTTTIADGATDPGRSMYLKYTGTLDSACTITIGPNTVSKVWIIENGTSGSQDIILSQGSGANITIPAGDTKVVYSDGAGAGAAFFDAFATINVGALTGTSLDISGDIDVDGTTNLDVVDIDGAVDMASTLAVAGVLTGASLDISGDIDVDGTTNLDVVDIDGAVDMASTLTVAGDANFDSNTLFVDVSANNVGIGGVPQRKLYVMDSTNGYNLGLQQTSAYNSGNQSGIVFSAIYDSSGNVTDVASIRGGKENTTDDNYAGNLLFYTRVQDGSDTERMRIESNGFTKHSNTGTYDTYSGADDSHQFVSDNASHSTVWVTNTNASYTAGMLRLESARDASSAFNFLAATSGNLADDQFLLRGDGNAFADGTWSGGGADYAEYFEWNDGNTNNEDRVGYSVSLVNNKIKIAESGETVIGVISGNPSVVGDDSWNSWKNKYLKDDFGRYVWENYTLTTWTTEDLIEKSYYSDRIPADEVVPEDAVITTQDSAGNAYKRKQLNPDYDDSLEYQDRESRAEWDIVGLMGKLRIRAGQEVGASWIKMQDISATVEEWLIK